MFRIIFTHLFIGLYVFVWLVITTLSLATVLGAQTDLAMGLAPTFVPDGFQWRELPGAVVFVGVGMVGMYAAAWAGALTGEAVDEALRRGALVAKLLRKEPG